jgi:hypothetical protein
MTTQLEQLKREFLQHLEIEKGNSLKTVNNYDYYLSRFLKFAQISNPSEIKDDNIREFRLFLNRQSGMKIKGQQSGTLKKNTLMNIAFLLPTTSSFPLELEQQLVISVFNLSPICFNPLPLPLIRNNCFD